MSPKKRGAGRGRGVGRGGRQSQAPAAEVMDEPTEVTETEVAPEVEEPKDEKVDEKTEEANGHDEEENEGHEKALDEEEEKEKSLLVKFRNSFIPPLSELDLHLMLHDIFVNELKITLPKVRLPKLKEKWIYVECHSLEDKKKILENLNSTYKYQDRPLEASSGWVQDVTKSNKPITLMDIDDALDILFKHRKLTYKEQLNLKTEETEKMVKEIFENLHKSHPKLNRVMGKCPEIGKIVPLTPVYGYSLDSSFAIEPDPVTNEVIVGLRATRNNCERVVPIDMCPSIPKPMADAVKDFVAHLREYGMEPFNRMTETGNVLGVQCKMSLSCEILLSVMIPRENKFFKEFVEIKTPEEVARLKEEAQRAEDAKKAEEAAKAEETANESTTENTEKVESSEKANDQEKPQNDKTSTNDDDKLGVGCNLENIKPGLVKYYEERGKKIGIVSIYANWVLYNNRGYWANRLFSHTHVCGATSVKEQTLNLQYDLWPYKLWSPRTSIFASIINTINSLVYFDRATSVVVASEYRIVALYYAKQCREVLNIGPWTVNKYNTQYQSDKKKFSWWMQKQGVQNMEFFAPKSSTLHLLDGTNFARSVGYKVAIIWAFPKLMLLQKLHSMGVKKVVTVFNVNRNIPFVQADVQRYLDSVVPTMVPTKIVPVDVHPHGNQYMLVCLLEEINPTPLIGNKRKGDMMTPAGNKRPRNFPQYNDRNVWDDHGIQNQFTDFMQKQMMFNKMMMEGGFNSNQGPSVPKRLGQDWGDYSSQDDSWGQNESNFTPRNRGKGWKNQGPARGGGHQGKSWSGDSANRQNFSNQFGFNRKSGNWN